MLKQVSVFVENKCGRLTGIVELLGNRGINIRAMSLADTADYGILRLVVNDPQKAADLLKSEQYTVKITEVLAIEIPDEAGALARVLCMLRDAEITIEYMYAFLGKREQGALVTLKCDDTEKAAELLKNNGVTIVESESIYQL